MTKRWNRGRVIEIRSPSAGISGVTVSDGRQVVTTDEQGCFALEFDGSRPFIMISHPSGYQLPSSTRHGALHYQSVDKPRDDYLFELVRAADSQDHFDFIYVTDLHLGQHNGLEQFKNHVQPKLIAHQCPFIVIGGDISFDEGVEQAYCELMRKFPFPAFHVMGNHDMMMKQNEPKKPFFDRFGPSYFSFNYGRFHFAVLDSCAPASWRSGWRSVIGAIDEVQLQWLKRDLEVLPADTPIIVFTHIPIVSHFSERHGLTPDDEVSMKVVDNEELIELLASFPVRLVLQGHVHENAHMHRCGVHYMESGAISGLDWHRSNRDGSPPGYRFVRICGRTATTDYLPIEPTPGSHRRLRIESPLPGGTVSNGTILSVNVFDGDPATTEVNCRINEGEWSALTAAPMQQHPHLWSCPLQLTNTAAGELLLEVAVSSHDGTDCQTIKLIRC